MNCSEENKGSFKKTLGFPEGAVRGGCNNCCGGNLHGGVWHEGFKASTPVKFSSRLGRLEPLRLRNTLVAAASVATWKSKNVRHMGPHWEWWGMRKQIKQKQNQFLEDCVRQNGHI